MPAPTDTSDKTTKKRVNAFSAKRLGIKKANTIIFASVAAAAVVVAICIVLLNFLWNLRGFNNRVITARSEALSTLETSVQNVDALERSFFALEQDEINSQVVLDALPSRYDFPALATSIDTQVEAANLTLRSFGGEDISAEAENSAINPEPVAINFTLSVEGNYDDIVGFIENFEKTIRPMVIDSIDLSGSDSTLRAQIEMHTFYQPAVDTEVETRTIR